MPTEIAPFLSKGKEPREHDGVKGERPSLYNKVAEGVVFKSLTNPEYSFKVISNTFLLNGGE